MAQTLTQILEFGCFVNQSHLKINELMAIVPRPTKEIEEHVNGLLKCLRNLHPNISRDTWQLYDLNFLRGLETKLLTLGDLGITSALRSIHSLRTHEVFNHQDTLLLKGEYRVIHEWLKADAQLIDYQPQLAQEWLEICINQIQRFKILEINGQTLDLLNDYFLSPMEMINMAKIGRLHLEIHPEWDIDMPSTDESRYGYLNGLNLSFDVRPLIENLNRNMQIISGRQSIERVIVRESRFIPSTETAHRLLFQFEPLLERFSMNDSICKGKMQVLLNTAYPDIFKWDKNFVELRLSSTHAGLDLEKIYEKKYDDAYSKEFQRGKKSILSSSLVHFKANAEFLDFLSLLRCFQPGLSQVEKIKRYVDYISKAPNKEHARFAAEILNYLITSRKIRAENLSPQNYETIIEAVESATYRQAMKKVMSTIHLKPEIDEISIAKQFRSLKDQGITSTQPARKKIDLLFEWLDLDKIYGTNLLFASNIKKVTRIPEPVVEQVVEPVVEQVVEPPIKHEHEASKPKPNDFLAAIHQGARLRKVEEQAVAPKESTNFLDEIRKGKKLRATSLSEKNNNQESNETPTQQNMLKTAQNLNVPKHDDSDSDSDWDDVPRNRFKK